MVLFACVPTGLGGFVWQPIPNPEVGGVHDLTIENGNIYWKNRVPEPPIDPQAGNDPDKEPPWRTVKRVSRRPKKRGKGKK